MDFSKFSIKKEEENKEFVEIKDYLDKGFSTSQILKIRTDLKYKQLHWIITKNGFEVKNRNWNSNPDSEYFNLIDNEVKSYILGFIIADGCITEENRLMFRNSIEDLEIITLIRNEISPNTKIEISENQNGIFIRKQQCCIRIKSDILCGVLINKFNIQKNKTKHKDFYFDFTLIPKEFHRDFVRGFFDGDGSVSFHLKNKTCFFDFSFVFTSFKFAEQIANVFIDLFDIRYVIYKKEGKTCNYFLLRFDYYRDRTRRIKEIYEYLYKDSIYYLNRKKVKFNQYFEYRANSRVNRIE